MKNTVQATSRKKISYGNDRLKTVSTTRDKVQKIYSGIVKVPITLKFVDELYDIFIKEIMLNIRHDRPYYEEKEIIRKFLWKKFKNLKEEEIFITIDEHDLMQSLSRDKIFLKIGLRLAYRDLNSGDMDFYMSTLFMEYTKFKKYSERKVPIAMPKKRLTHNHNLKKFRM